MNPNPTHEILVCGRCGHQPRACRCAHEIPPHPSSASPLVRSIKEREIVKRRELTRRGVRETVEILLEAIERDGFESVRFKLDRAGDPVGDATDAADLKVLRRALSGGDGVRHARPLGHLVRR